MASNGLVHIATQSFSAVSSVSFDNCFSSTYYHYYLKGAVSSNLSESAAVQNLRLRSGGSDDSSALYDRQRIEISDGVTSALRSTNQTGVTNIIGDNKTGLWGYFDAWIHGPYEGIYATFQYVNNSYTTSTIVLYPNHAVHRSASAYDGMTIYISSGTMSGDLSVWGLVKA